MENDPCKKYEDDANDYLRSSEHRYVLNVASRMYQPKAFASEAEGRDNPAGTNRHKRFHVSVLHDWLAICLSALTLLLLFFTVRYTRKQWLENNRSANASEIAAHAAKSAAETALATLTEMQTGQGSRDTHTLAQQAVTQALQTTSLANDTHDLATAAGQQAASSGKIAAASSKSADTAAQELESSQRPWLKIDIDPHTVIKVLPNGYASAQIHIAGINVGHSPAMEAHAGAMISSLREYPTPRCDNNNWLNALSQSILLEMMWSFPKANMRFRLFSNFVATKWNFLRTTPA